MEGWTSFWASIGSICYTTAVFGSRWVLIRLRQWQHHGRDFYVPMVFCSWAASWWHFYLEIEIQNHDMNLHKRSRLNMKIGYLQSFHQFASVFNTASAPYISQCPPCCPHPKRNTKKPSQKLNPGCWVACFWSLSILEQRVWYTVKLSCWSLVYFIHSSTPRPGGPSSRKF